MASNQVPSGLSQTITVDGSTDWVKVTGPAMVSMSNSFGTGTATIQFKDQADAAIALAGETHTVAADRLIDYPAGAKNELRVNLASSSSPDLDVVIQSSSVHDLDPGRSIGTTVA